MASGVPEMPDRHGPMRTGRFKVKLGGTEIAGVQRVALPSRSTEQDEYREGSAGPKKLWGETTFDDLEMERGLAPGATALLDWRRAVEEGRIEEGLKEVTVVLMNENGESVLQWDFTDAWPKNYEPPQLDASADGDIATESVTVAFDQMNRTEP